MGWVVIICLEEGNLNGLSLILNGKEMYVCGWGILRGVGGGFMVFYRLLYCCLGKKVCEVGRS